MQAPVNHTGVATDPRLAPVGLAQLLGTYGARRRGAVLGLAAVLLALSSAAALGIHASAAWIAVAFILPVALVAAEMGMRAGLATAALGAAVVILSPASGWTAEGASAVLPRSLALLFLAFVVGRMADRALRSRHLLEALLQATTDSIYLKDRNGRYLLVNSAAASLIGQPASAIIGHTNRELLPDVAEDIARHDADVLDSDSPAHYEITGTFGVNQPILSVTKSPFRDASGETIGALGIARDITEERRLQAESTRFFELSGDLLCTVDFEGRLQSVNGQWCRTLGWSVEELIGRPVCSLIAPEDHDELLLASREAHDDGAPGRGVTARWRTADGSWRWIDWTLRTVPDEGLIYASGRDVTQRLADERALADSERRYRTLVHGLPGTTVILVDRTLRLEFASGRRLAGASPSPRELIGGHVNRLLPAAHGAALQDACRAALAGEERGFDLVSAGDDLALWIRTSPLRGDGEEIVGAMLIAQNVHERIERERQMGEAQERFRRAFEDAPIGMAVADLEGNYLEVNQALCEILERPAGQLCEMSFAAITHPQDLTADLKAMADLIDGRQSSSLTEKRYLRANGGVVWVTRTVTIVRDASGAPLHFLDQVQDVTERRRFEHELRHLADHDPLTGLYNRRRFEQELEQQVGEVARAGPRGALLVLDIDNFKYVNDALGHHAGDALILSVAGTLRGRLRESDTLARLGGDEFAVLLPNVDEHEAQIVAGDLVRAIREEATVGSPHHHRRVTTSVGVAPFRAGDVTGAQLLISADLAMYHAKETGRDRFALISADTEQPDSIRARS